MLLHQERHPRLWMKISTTSFLTFSMPIPKGLEEATGLVIIFIISRTGDKAKVSELVKEVAKFDDFMLLDIKEEYRFWISMCKTRASPSTCLCSTRILNVYIMRQSKETLKGMSLSSYSMLEHLQEGKEFVFKLNLGNHKMCGLIRNYVVAFTFTSDFNLKKPRRKFCLYMEMYLDG
nr:PREDICTED: uncharacterized protein LOC108198154 [Daucus carota subsp. sativus]